MTARQKKTAATQDGPQPQISAFRAQHLSLARSTVTIDGRLLEVLTDDNESPLAWLARRKGRDGATLISAAQFVAGERLRADFTRAQMTPRVTSNWSSPLSSGRRLGGSGAADASDAALAARQRVRHALTAVGPEFAGLLMDVCCFLRGLEDAEKQRHWPQRSAKVVLQLALDSLARHYGLTAETRGDASRLTHWLADDVAFSCDLESSA